MAANFLSNASTFIPCISSVIAQNKRHVIVCSKAVNESSIILSKRKLSISLTTTLLLSLAGKDCFDHANAAILEADDDVELLEKVKKDRLKRLEKQSIISTSKKEKEYLQDLIYKLSKVGQAIENNDLPTAGSVLGQSSDSEWVQNANAALTKLSTRPEEKTEVDTIYSSLSCLISSVVQKDIEASKIAFVASASALEKWTALTGLVGQLKGL